MFVLYDKPSGDVIQFVTNQWMSDVAAYESPEVGVLLLLEDLDIYKVPPSYICLETLTLLPKEDYGLATLPLPCTARIEGVEYPVDEQPEFEFDLPGVYQIEIIPVSPRYLTKTFTIEIPNEDTPPISAPEAFSETGEVSEVT
jgi:hypothetical protein